MSLSARDKRTRLVDAGARLVHQQGFHRTTLADVAETSRVPLGNVYYYFKTKEALGEAVIEQYVSQYESLRSTWDAKPNPKARLKAFIQASVDSPEVLARSGCPLATLSSELRKDNGHLADCATRLFADALAWIEKTVPSAREVQGRGTSVGCASALGRRRGRCAEPQLRHAKIRGAGGEAAPRVDRNAVSRLGRLYVRIALHVVTSSPRPASAFAIMRPMRRRDSDVGISACITRLIRPERCVARFF
jgi:AcrR family transcriptional regulator